MASVTIGNGVTSIGEAAFEGCTGLTMMDIPNSVISIGDMAFSDCENLASVTIGDGVTIIGEFAFQDCTNLSSVTFGESVTSIGSGAFIRTNITSLSVPDNVTYVGDRAFHETPWLEGQPDGLLYIGKVAYKYIGNTYNLHSISLKEGCTGISSGAFLSCSYLSSIDIPGTVTFIGSGAFSGCSNLLSISLPQGITSIDDETFQGCSSLQQITIPENVTYIGYHAFDGCSGITSITIPRKVNKIKWYSFSDCNNLGSIVVDSENPTYDSRDNCNAIIETATNKLIIGCKNTVVPTSVTAIESYAFDGCNITEVFIPSGMTSIGKSPFIGCENITSIIVDSANPVYDSRNNCNAIIETSSNALIMGCKNTVIPNGVLSIGDYSFDGCVGLTSINIPNSVTSIGSAVFQSCYNLASITIPNSVITIGSSAFRNCTSLTFVDLPDNITIINNGTFWGSGLKSINIPLGVATIDINAFWRCQYLNSITIPSSVSKIEGYAFYDCNAVNDVYCFADPANLTWNGNTSNDNFRTEKGTRFHVIDKTAWEEKFPDVNVTYVGMEDIKGTKEAKSAYWSSYFNSVINSKVDDNTVIYKVYFEGQDLKTAPIGGKIIKAGQAVILKSSMEDVEIIYTQEESYGDYSGNCLKGTDIEITNPGNAYVLNHVGTTLGFYKLSAAGTIGAHKAYIPYTGNLSRDCFALEDETTAISDVSCSMSSEENIYNLNGQHVSSPSKGLYIVKGKKLVVK